MSKGKTDTVERTIEQIAREAAETHFGLSGAKRATVEKHILVIKSFIFTSAGFVQNISNPKPQSEANIQVRGKATSNGKLELGYIRFVPTSALKRPQLSANKKRLDLWIDQEYMDMTLRQFQHANKYLWIGFYAGGHIYSDIHSAP